MRTESRKSRPAFAAVALVASVGLFAVHGAASGVVLLAAMLGFIAACIRALAGEKVDDGCGGIGGGTSF